MTDTVYFYETENLIKVGFSRDLKHRPLNLDGSDGFYIGAMLGGRDLERTFKEEFVAFRAYGEYFHKDPIIVATITRVLAKFGVLGDECVRLTEPEIPLAERVPIRDGEIKQRCAEIVAREIEKLTTSGCSIMSAMSRVSETTGIRYGLVKNLRYATGQVAPTPAEVEVLFALENGGIT